MFTCPPALLSGNRIYTGVLDAYKSGLWGAYGLSRVIGSWGIGFAVNVRRSSDNATADIRLLSNGSLDSTTLTSFVGANDGFVTIWYDQSGGGNNFVQATSANQPRIVSSGTYLGYIEFNLSVNTQALVTTNLSSSSTATKSIFRKILDNVGLVPNTVEFVYGDPNLIGTASGSNQFYLLKKTSPNNNNMLLATNSGAGFYNVIYDTLNEASGPVGIIIKKGQGTAAATFTLYQGGGVIGNTFSGTTGSVTTSGNFPGYAWSLGNSGAGSSRFRMYTCALYDSDQSANANAINTAIA